MKRLLSFLLLIPFGNAFTQAIDYPNSPDPKMKPLMKDKENKRYLPQEQSAQKESGLKGKEALEEVKTDHEHVTPGTVKRKQKGE